MPVAQLDRVSDCDSEGHRFESCRARHLSIHYIITKSTKAFIYRLSSYFLVYDSPLYPIQIYTFKVPFTTPLIKRTKFSSQKVLKMPKIVAPLNDAQVKNAKPREKDYLVSDGSGLYLNVKSIGSKVWTIPAERMKMRNDHIVSLSKQAIAILKEIQPFTGRRELVFASCYGGNKIMSENTVNNALKRIGFGDEQTGHGFRHTASTMLHEAINEHGAHSLVIEACLAHKDTNEIRAVYNKAQYVEERRRLMQWWADFVDSLK